jgi:ketosteroid isomerase-like protein
MKINSGIFLVSALLLPMFASAEDWTKEQKEVLAFEEACVTTKDVDEFMGCFHEDYVGWGQGSTVPLSKSDRQKPSADYFENNDGEVLLFKPLSVIVKGNMAVISYITRYKSTNKTTGEVTYGTGRWTDVCLKEGGKWTWISDDGVDLSDD